MHKYKYLMCLALYENGLKMLRSPSNKDSLHLTFSPNSCVWTPQFTGTALNPYRKTI